MSRIGKKPVDIPAGVTVTVAGRSVAAKGAKGELTIGLPPLIAVAVSGKTITVTRADDTKEARGFHGLARTLIANLVHGVSVGYNRELELQGVGFRAAEQGGNLTLTLGYSSPIVHAPPAGIRLSVKEGIITVSGPDKKVVGDVAAHIRSFYPPEPYKGKGIRYRGEYVRRKAGKTVA